MNFNDQIKRFKRAIARYGLFGFSAVFTKLPYSLVRIFSHIFIAFGFCFAIRQKQIARESLKIAFSGEKSDQEIKDISRQCFTNFGRGMIELIYFMDHPQMIKERVHFQGKEHLDKAFEGGKGVIVVSAHFGSFPLMLLRFAQEGYKTNAIIRRTRDEIIEEHFQKQRTRLGLNTVYSHPRKACVDTSIRVLRNNELLFIPLDQNFGSGGGVFVDFFGQKAATATGPVIFARRTGAPILPIFVVRQKDDTHKIIIEEPLELKQFNDEQEAIVANTAQITQVIEQYVRRYPHEWGWMHRRWKSQPREKRETG